MRQAESKASISDCEAARRAPGEVAWCRSRCAAMPYARALAVPRQHGCLPVDILTFQQLPATSIPAIQQQATSRNGRLTWFTLRSDGSPSEPPAAPSHLREGGKVGRSVL